MALPELPDDRRAAPRRYASADQPISARPGQPVPPGQRPLGDARPADPPRGALGADGVRPLVDRAGDRRLSPPPLDALRNGRPPLFTGPPPAGQRPVNGGRPAPADPRHRAGEPPAPAGRRSDPAGPPFPPDPRQWAGEPSAVAGPSAQPIPPDPRQWTGEPPAVAGRPPAPPDPGQPVAPLAPARPSHAGPGRQPDEPSAGPRHRPAGGGPAAPAEPGRRPGSSGQPDPTGPSGSAVGRPTEAAAPAVQPAGADPVVAETPGRHRRRAGDKSAESGPVTGAATGTPRKRSGRRRRSTFWKELPILVVVALLLTFLIQTFLAKVYVIPSGSMETTLHGCVGCNNDRVLVDKVSYRFADPAPGDVVVFRGPDSWSSEVIVQQPTNALVRGLQLLGSLVGLAPPDEKDFVKRVIAVGGQTVQCCDSRNRVLVDGKPLTEPYTYYLPEAGPARQNAFGPVTVPSGQLWMMGDSRNNSADSRVADHGPVPVQNVIGKARLIVLPLPRFGPIASVNPQVTAVGMPASGADGGPPLALGLLGTLPLALLRRRPPVGEAELDGFLPPGPGDRARGRHR